MFDLLSLLNLSDLDTIASTITILELIAVSLWFNSVKSDIFRLAKNNDSE